MAALAIPPELAAALIKRYGSIDDAYDAAMDSPEWGASIDALPSRTDFLTRAAWVLQLMEQNRAAPTASSLASALPRWQVQKVEEMLADKKSRNAIAKETGLSKRQVDKIIAWKLGTGGPGGTGFEREPGPRENTWVFVPKSTSRRTSRRSAATARQGTDEPRIY